MANTVKETLDKSITIRITKSDHDRLQELADENERKFSDYVRLIISKHIKENTKNE